MRKKKTTIDWSKVKVNTPILVKDHYEERWTKRYFAKYSDGRVYAWADGKTSWTADGYMIDWDCAKLAKKEN